MKNTDNLIVLDYTNSTAFLATIPKKWDSERIEKHLTEKLNFDLGQISYMVSKSTIQIESL